MAGPTFFIGTRKANGQISSISEGLSPSNFIDLFKDKGEKRVLIDYSPLIEKLHDLHKSSNEEQIRNEYNSLFNYWQEAKSYEDKSYRMHCSSTLTTQANGLINKLQQKLQKSKNDGGLTWNLNPYQMNGTYQLVESFRADAEMYIDALLIYIHSKASVEIGSFKRDAVLQQYGKFLQELIQEMYSRLLGIGRYGRADSFLTFLALERPADLKEYLALDGRGESPDSFVWRILRENKPYESYDKDFGYRQELSIQYDNFWPNVISLIEVLKNLLYKISSVNELLAALRAGEVEWDDDFNSVNELRTILQLER